MRKFWRHYFQALAFRRLELLGLFLILASILILVTDWDKFTVLFGKPLEEPPYLSQDSVLRFIEQQPAKNVAWHQDSLFFFDPNTATLEDFIILGLREKTAKTILKYRSKGGKFRRPEDLEKIYSISRVMYAKLKPYIRIAGANTVKSKPINPTELNSADSTKLMEIPIMRGFMARKIVKYRGFLGGYYKVQQLLEVYGLDSNFYSRLTPYLLIAPNSWQKISINEADYNALRHPYISSEMRKEILAYRRKVGDFNEAKDLLKLFTIDSIKLQKVLPYIRFN